METTDAILLQDVLSVFRDKKSQILYGKRGEKVKLINNHGNVWIVKGKNGPFPVNIESLKILSNAQKEETNRSGR